MDKQQTEEQSGEDKTESIEIMLGVGPGNLSSFEMAITFKRTQYHVYFTWASKRLIERRVNFKTR